MKSIRFIFMNVYMLC